MGGILSYYLILGFKKYIWPNFVEVYDIFIKKSRANFDLILEIKISLHMLYARDGQKS